MSIVLSQTQKSMVKNVLAAIENGTKIIVTDSMAGTGKTTIVESVAQAIADKFPTLPVLAWAYNSNAGQLLDSLLVGENTEGSTIHSYFKRVLWRKFSKRDNPLKVDKDGYEHFNFATLLTNCALPRNEASAKKSALYPVICAFRQAYGFNTVADDTNNGKRLYLAGIIASFSDTLKEFALTGDEQVNDPRIVNALELRDLKVNATEVLPVVKASLLLLKTTVQRTIFGSRMVSFADILWLAYILRDSLPWKKVKLLIVDECQDITPLKWELINLMRYDHLYMIGDPMQAIHEYMGATADYMLGHETYRLAETWRYGKVICDLVNSLFPGRQHTSHESVPDGRIIDAKDIASDIIPNIVPGDTVLLARKTADLIVWYKRLLDHGVVGMINGHEEIGIDIINCLADVRDLEIEDAIAQIRQSGGNIAECAISFVALFGDIASAIDACSRAFGINVCVKCNHAMEKISKGSFSFIGCTQYKKGCKFTLGIDNALTPVYDVLLSTVHRQKGNGYKVVIALEYTIDNKDAESNVYYVMLTRAKDTLIRVTSDIVSLA